LNNGSVPNGTGRKVSGVNVAEGWTVFQPFDVTDPGGWTVTSIGIDGWRVQDPPGLGQTGMICSDDGTGTAADCSKPLAVGVHQLGITNPFESGWAFADYNIVLAGNARYWFVSLANDPNYWSSVFHGAAGPASYSIRTSDGQRFESGPTALQIPCLLDSPGPGDDTCQTPGVDLGTACSTNADCMVAGSACSLKSRYVSADPTNGCGNASIQVEIVSMPQFPARVGEIWWAGVEQNVPNSPNPALRGAPLQCTVTPNSQTWTAGVLHLWGQAIVPGSTYNVRMCDAGGGNCSDPLLVATAKWGDVIRPFGGGSQPNFGDVSAIVAKFGNVASAPSTPRTDVVGPQAPGTPNTPNQGTNFADVSNDVSAFSGFAYPYTVPACP